MKCIFCNKNLEIPEANICKGCLEILRRKYPNLKKFERRLKWHIKNAEEIKE